MKKITFQDKLLFDPHPKDERFPGFEEVLMEHNYFKLQREGLKMTQQEVADKAHINIRQYQRIESGERSLSSTSLRIGLAICDVLGLDPHRFVCKL